MQFYISNPPLDGQINDILRKIKLSMNGVVSEQMTKHGIVYKQNYGVSIPRLREIAMLYEKNHDLAQRLWMIGIRETMILATLLEPENTFTKEDADKWMNQVNQIELVEQLCMNLFSKLPFANELSQQWILSDTMWEQVTGFTLSARIYMELDETEIKTIVSAAIEKSATGNLHIYKAIALCLSRFIRKDKTTAEYIMQTIESISSTNSTGQQYISHEVKEELFFLNSL